MEKPGGGFRAIWLLLQGNAVDRFDARQPGALATAGCAFKQRRNQVRNHPDRKDHCRMSRRRTRFPH